MKRLKKVADILGDGHIFNPEQIPDDWPLFRPSMSNSTQSGLSLLGYC